MIDFLISQYLRQNKRLVVPGFGAFIRKDEGEVVFMEFLKKDDSVLANLVREALQTGEDEARAAIEDFAGQVKGQIAEQGYFTLEGLGVMRREGGLYELRYDPSVRREEQPVAEIEESQEADDTEPYGIERDTPHETGASGYESLAGEIPENVIVMERREEIVPEPDTAPRAKDAAGRQQDAAVPQERQKGEARDWYGVPLESERQERGERGRERERERERAKERERAAVTGFGESPRVAERPGKKVPPRPAGYAAPKRKRTDLVMIIAIIAALIAVGSIVFGIMTPADPSEMVQPTHPQQTEEPVTAPAVDTDTPVE